MTSRINVWQSSVLSACIMAVELTLWSACSVGQERSVVDSMRPVPHCDLLWQARSSAERVNGKMRESNPLSSWVVWQERRDWWKEQEGEDVCKRPAALTFLWIKHKVFSVLARRPHLLHPTCAAHIWNKLPRLLDMLMWMYFYQKCWGLTGGCLLLNFSCFKCPDDFELFFLFWIIWSLSF